MNVFWPLTRLASSTTAKIQPTSLAPNMESGEKLKSKMVNFAVVLRPSRATEEGFRNLDAFPNAPSESFNQTCINTIVDKPIALSIETKSSNSAADEGLPQLSIWACAQYAKLRQLTASARHKDSGPVQLPVLPLIIAQGVSWTFFAASQDLSGKTVSLHQRKPFIPINGLTVRRFSGNIANSARLIPCLAFTRSLRRCKC